jgi:hypothetical protein
MKNAPRQLPSPNLQFPDLQNPSKSIPVGCWGWRLGVDHGFFSTSQSYSRTQEERALKPALARRRKKFVGLR